MKPLLFSLFTPTAFLEKFKNSNQFEIGNLITHEFPDHESYIKFQDDLKGRHVIFIASLDFPNAKFLPLIFALKAAKDLGASQIGLIVPYLPYMRQDKQFSSGEAVTSKYFSSMLASCIDWLITIDPHLHRYHSLNEIYPISTYVVPATSAISNWIQQHVPAAFIIGPDKESEQWVEAIAKSIQVPYIVLNKTRTDDTHVKIEMPDLSPYKDYTPVLVDDIISTGTTLVETIKHLKNNKMKAPICIGVHAIFADHADANILAAGAKAIVTCNTVEHVSNSIDITDLIIDCLKTNQAI